MTNRWTVDKLLKWDRTHLVHPAYPLGENKGIMFEKGKGIVLQDTEGKEYLDFCAQAACVNLGYGQSELVDAAAEQMHKLGHSTIFRGFSHRPSIECAIKLAEVTAEGLDHFFFTDSGSESVETAFKLARQYWRNKGTNKYKIISLYDSYHGVTFGALSATGMGRGSYEGPIAPLVPGFIRIPPYYCYRCMFGKVYPKCGIQCAKYLAEVIEKEGSETIAAFIAEPVLGSAGMIPPPAEYWPMIREICTAYDVLLIVDEVQSGFCRTGKMFALEHWKVKPDLTSMSKGITSAYLSLGAVAFNGKVYEGLEGAAISGFTNSGHPVACALATKTIEIYTRDKIADNAARVGKHILDRLNAEFKSLSCVGEISGLGLMGGIEIVADKATKRWFDPALHVVDDILARALEKGLYLRGASSRRQISDRVLWSPPLIITAEEADRALDVLRPIIGDLKPN